MTAAPSTGRLPRWNTWADADFVNPRADRWPDELLALERWMGHVEKRPFAPWADRDHPEAGPDEDARWKWGLRDNYLDGERIALAEADHRLDGRVFNQRADDPYAFVDGDDVRCPETGAIHPVFVALLEHLGRTYADVSTSGTGVHAYYRGDLPLAGNGQVAFEIDTNPWGANDAPPPVEIYANKHVCVATGAHVPGSGTEVTAWDTDSLRAVLEAHGYRDEEGDHIVHDTDRDRPDLAQHTPTATHAEQQTTDVRDVSLADDRPLAPSGPWPDHGRHRRGLPPGGASADRVRKRLLRIYCRLFLEPVATLFATEIVRLPAVPGRFDGLTRREFHPTDRIDRHPSECFGINPNGDSERSPTRIY